MNSNERVILQENTDKLVTSCSPSELGRLKLNILQRYIFREWLWTFLAAVIILLIVMIGVSLGELLNDIAGGRVPAGLLWTLMMLKIPEVLGTIMPLAVFIAIIWGLGRLYRDQEMAVMRASGFHWRMLLRPLFNLMLPISALLLAIGLFVGPMASSEAQLRLKKAFRNATEWGLQAGQFHVLRGGDLVLYVESVEKDGRTLRNVFIQLLDGEREQIWNAEQGYYWLDSATGHRYLTLENGQITEGGLDSLDFSILRFSRNDLRLPEASESQSSVDLEARPSSELLLARSPPEAAEMQWRLSPALAAIVLGLLAIPLSHSAPREGRGGRAVLGVLAYTVYANLLYMSRSWIASDNLPAFVGMWWVHLLVLVAALIWLRRQGRMVGGA
jgi:lipopolysaccharide export system permease protein